MCESTLVWQLFALFRGRLRPSSPVMSLGIRLVPYLAYRIFFINCSFEHIYYTYFYVRFILLLFNPIQSSPNNLKSVMLDSTQT